MVPSFTTSMAGFARGSIFTNHWVETRGSTTVWQRWQVPTLCLRGSTLIR